MKRRIPRAPAAAVVVLVSLGGFFLRLRQLATAFDENGLPASKTSWIGFAVYCAAALAIFGYLAVNLAREKEFSRVFYPSGGAAALGFTGAGVLLAGNIVPLLGNGVTVAVRAASFIGVVCALCFVGTTSGQFKGKRSSAFLYLAPILYYILQLVLNFKGWSADPTILDYCFKLFAMIATMLAVFHIGGFRFDAGKRRTAVFYAMAAVYFCAVTLADGGLSHGLIMGGGALWIASCLWQMLKDQPK